MFDGRSHNPATRPQPGCPEQSQIVRLGAAAQENDLARIACQQVGEGPAGRFDPLPCPLAEIMDTGGVAVNFAEGFGERAEDFGGDGGRRVVIEIRMPHVISFYRFDRVVFRVPAC